MAGIDVRSSKTEVAWKEAAKATAAATTTTRRLGNLNQAAAARARKLRVNLAV